MMTTTPQDTPRDGGPERSGRARQVREFRRAQPVREARTHLSMAGLRARGWTAALVRRLLGEPDLLRPHPLFRTARQIRLYRVERVEAAERGDEFRAVAAAAARRSAEARTTRSAGGGRVVAPARGASARTTCADVAARAEFGCGSGPMPG
jgi:hypothetical protein